MFKLVIVLTLLVYYTNALGVLPIELGDSLSEITSKANPSTSTEYLLPSKTKPFRYDVKITSRIDEGKFEFTGHVKIYLEAVDDIDRIVIHQRSLTIDNYKLSEVEIDNNNYIEVGDLALKTHAYDPITEFLTFELDNTQTLDRGKMYKLEIDYEGVLRGSKAGNGETDAGFYRSSYTNAAGDEVWLATTQFESTDARHAFPCYDEPALKAVFNIELKHGATYKAISNMPQLNSIVNGDIATTTFEETPKMSTYLIAFVISDFKCVSNVASVGPNEVLHSVCGVPDRNTELDFTLEAGVKILDELDKYLGVEYFNSIQKMDQIGIPDFAAGAMENWGLVTYTESAFYYSATTSPHTQKDRIAKIIAHEFAHQWFGNLVSPEWWNYIWLNEGFATVFEYYIPNILYPEYKALDYFTIQVCQRVLITDSTSDIRPMTFDAYTPKEISALFDRVAYDKSGCVITMMMHAVGETAFKAGLTEYLKTRSYKEANSEHLFDAIQAEALAEGTMTATTTVNDVFGKWSTQRGYPILTVTFDKAGNKDITLKQEAFLIDSPTDANKLKWTIPYNFITNEELTTVDNENTATQGWLTTDTDTLSPLAPRDWSTAEWVLFNKKLTGYYRVNYNTDNWNALISYMANKADAEKVHYLNRAQLLGDAMNIARADRLSYDIPLQLALNMMKHETSYFTWTPFINDFNYLEQTTFETTTYPKLLKFAIEVGTDAYNDYTISETTKVDYYDIITRFNLVNFMCKVGFSKCLEDTNTALISYLDDPLLTVSSYLKPAILQNGLRNADSALFLKVLKGIMDGSMEADRSAFIGGLGLTNSEENMQILLGSLLTENTTVLEGVTIYYGTTEITTILTTIASNSRSGFRRVLDLLETEEETVKNIIGDDIYLVLSTLASRTSTEETLVDLDDLMVAYKLNDDKNRFAGYKSIAEQNIKWHKDAGAKYKTAIDKIYEDETIVPPVITGYILPEHTVPIRYDVKITSRIDQGKFDFNGHVKIYLKALSDADRIVIHHRELTIKSIKLISVTEKNDAYEELGLYWPLKQSEYNVTNEFLTIPLYYETLKTNDLYKLEIDYEGVLRGSKAGTGIKNAGFYRSSYTNAAGDEVWLATTQFESTDARHGFPCYDEPALKAKFNIELVHGATYSAISNMPQLNSIVNGDIATTTFEETPKMSTYLIAFVISDFDYISNAEGLGADKVLQRVFGVPARKTELNFTLEAGVKILDKLDEYLGIKYYNSIKKMDQIGIPDFAAGAMENWGLVTYTESAFYYSATTSPHTQKDRISKIVAHEFAHQWFGNLVSPKWWNYIWLNEGFATVFEYYIPNIVYPDYKALDYFTIQVCQRVLITDSTSSIRPMTFDAYSPSEISALFDRIAYDKSGCVITMMMHAVGEKAFKAGLTRYLKARSYEEATSEDLFTAIQTEALAEGTMTATTTVNDVFGKWSTQRGYPILTVTFDKAENKITLKQEAFLIDSLTDASNLKWTIPYNFITNDELAAGANENTTTQGWLTTETQTLSSTAQRDWSTAEWVLFNKKLTGYYRVNYDTDNWNALISYMANKDDAEKIHYLNRAQLLGDAMNIARANRSSYDIPLRLAHNMMKHETSYFTWSPFINDFNYLEQITFETTNYPKLLRFAIEVGTDAYNDYTISETTKSEYYDIITRFNLVNFMCKVGFSKCLEDTNTALISYLDNKLTVSSYLKPAILQNGLRNADSALFLQVWKLIMASKTQADRSAFIPGLGLTNSEENIETLISSVLTEDNTLFSDVTINYSGSERTTILTTIASNKVTGLKRILELLKTEAVKVKKIFSNSNIATLFSTLASRTSSAATLVELKELMVLYVANDVDSRFAGYTATAEQNIKWNAEAGNTIKAPLDIIIGDISDDTDAANSVIVSTALVTITLLISRLLA